MKYKEIEFKYNADAIKLTAFTEFCTARKPINFTMAAGYDYFYTNPTQDDSFGRHRVGIDYNQLTFKRKTSTKNSFIRDEDNLLMASDISTDQVRSLFDKFGYYPNSTIYKNCFIYKYPKYTLVYYIVYTEELSEIGRFFEIEMSEEHKWESEDQAWQQLLDLEKECKSIGITAQSRIKKSLQEMVCK